MLLRKWNPIIFLMHWEAVNHPLKTHSLMIKYFKEVFLAFVL